jgi:DNA polymerase elongation subunit (family B)
MKALWKRPRPEGAEPPKAGNDVDFMFVDATYRVKPNAYPDISKLPYPELPVIELFGVTLSGYSVNVHVHGFLPYFYTDSSALLSGKQSRTVCDRVLELMETLMTAQRVTSNRSSSADGRQSTGLKRFVHQVDTKRATSIYGHHEHPLDFLRITMLRPGDVPAARGLITDHKKFISLKNGGLRKCYEANVEFIIRFMIDAGITGCGWVTAPGGTFKNRRLVEERDSSCDLEFDIHWKDLVGHSLDEPEWQQVAPLVMVSMDAEVRNSVEGHFPDYREQGDMVISIANYVRVLGEDTARELNVFMVGTSDPLTKPKLRSKDPDLPDPVVYSFDTEADMLRAWYDYINTIDADIITGYNIYGFDMEYIEERMRYDKVEEEEEGKDHPDEAPSTRKKKKRRKKRIRFHRLGKLRADQSNLRSHKFQNNAYGKKNYRLPATPGRIQLDALEAIRRDVTCKFRSYKLDAVSDTILGLRKVDVHYKEITPLFEGSDADRARLGEYNLMDVVLPDMLLEDKAYVYRFIEEARVCNVPMLWLLIKGQQVKVMAQILRETVKEDLLIPMNRKFDIDPNKRQNRFKGAIVIDPIAGYYTDCVVVLDFASLYPSIMRRWNLCFTTWVPPGPLRARLRQGIDYEVAPNGHAFLKEEVKEGLLPRILTYLLTARSRAKKDMAAAAKTHGKNSPEYKKQDGRQQALKVSANSCYGFTGALVGRLPCLAISSAVTGYGRYLIEQTKATVEALNPSKYRVIYGDSVTGDTPILVKTDDGGVEFKRIDRIVTEYEKRSDGKEEGWLLGNLQVWTDSGWTRIRRVIRHETRKKIWRVLTHTGAVDVTQDHSLLLPNGDETHVDDVKVGTALMHHSPASSIPHVKPDFTVDEAFAMGVFLACGSCNSYYLEKYSWKHSWVISKSDKDVLTRCKNSLPFETKILNGINSSSVYKLVPENNGTRGVIRDIVKRYRTLFYNKDKQKVVPSEILCAPDAWAQAFFDGFYAGAGSKGESYKSFDQKGKITTAGLFLLAERLGWNASLNALKTNPETFRVTLSSSSQHESPDKIKRLWERTKDEPIMVYDLETENHHFHVAPGNMVVHNTDSVMVRLVGVTNVQEALDIGDVMEAACDGIFQKPVKIEKEKVFYPYALFTKKRYAGLHWERSDFPYYINSKGLISVRRDNALFASDLFGDCLNTIYGYNDAFDNVLKFVESIYPVSERGDVPVVDASTGALIEVRHDEELASREKGDIYAKICPQTGEVLRPGWVKRRDLITGVEKKTRLGDGADTIYTCVLDNENEIESIEKYRDASLAERTRGLVYATFDPETGQVVKPGWVKKRVASTGKEWVEMVGDSVGAAIQMVQDTRERLYRGDIPLDMLTISKAFSREPSEYAAKQPHVELALRMAKRDAGSAPKIGDRVPFVVVKRGFKAALCEKAEDPPYVLEHGVPIDYEYYDSRQLKKPVTQLFAPILAKHEKRDFTPPDEEEKDDDEMEEYEEGDQTTFDQMMKASAATRTDSVVLAERKLFPQITKRKVEFKGASVLSAGQDRTKRPRLNAFDLLLGHAKREALGS